MARIRHLGWACYQMGAGQEGNFEPSQDQLISLMQGVKFALDNPGMTSEENHDNWMIMKASQGWKWGKRKDFTKKEHPDMVPFDDLPDVEKKKDFMDRIMNDKAEILWEYLIGRGEL